METNVQHTSVGWYDYWSNLLFWGWNDLLLALVVFGFAPTVMVEIMRGVSTGIIPGWYLLCALAIIIAPAVSVRLGLRELKHSPKDKLKLLLVIEGPVVSIAWVCIDSTGWLTPATLLLLACWALGILAFLWQLFDAHLAERASILRQIQFVGLTLLFILALYLLVWLSFYILPGVNLLAQTFPVPQNFPVSSGYRLAEALLVLLLTLVLAAISMGILLLLVSLPAGMLVAAPLFIIQAWVLRLCQERKQGHLRRTLATGAAVGTVFVIALVWVNNLQQPQQKAFALLAHPPTSVTQRQALLAQSAMIRRGLLNAYLAPEHYAGVVGAADGIGSIYSDYNGLGMPVDLARNIQRLHDELARPFLYVPAQTEGPFSSSSQNILKQDSQHAADLYQQFFDRPITAGEREALVAKARSTWETETALAAWQEVDDREVRLVRQEVTVQEHGDWAEIELYEVYYNQTFRRQEVVYYFSLPESAVITGLWLGYSPKREERFVFRLATRGAAQQLYRQEVARRTDPALVEQIGPRQYRLRIFPVEPNHWAWRGNFSSEPENWERPLYLWMTWQVMATQGPEAGWPMPVLSEKFNVFWDGGTERLVNGHPMFVKAQEWLPERLPAAGPVQAATHRVDFRSGQSVIVGPARDARTLRPDGLCLAVVLDRSYSMSAHAEEVKSALEQLSGLALPPVRADAPCVTDVYLSAAPTRGEVPVRVALADLDAKGIVYYGGQNAAELLEQYEQLAHGRTYDAILVLTDAHGYTLEATAEQFSLPDAPVWLVHMGPGVAIGYDDRTLEAIQSSGGGVVGRLDEALQRIAVAQQASKVGQVADLVDGYVWLTLPGQAAQMAPDPAFSALAGRYLVLSTLQRQRDRLDELEVLDGIHQIAQENSIVTPYSSMIVLVNERQQSELDRLEKQPDRFQREQEQTGETTNRGQVSNAQANGTPEPDEWLLILAGLGLLGWYVWCKKRSGRAPVRVAF